MAINGMTIVMVVVPHAPCSGGGGYINETLS